MAPGPSFHYEVDRPKDDQPLNEVTTIKCHGRLVCENAGQIKELVMPFIPLGGRIVLDLTNLNYLDSTGLGALVALKASAIKQGLCKLQLVNMTPRVLELVRITGLAQLFSS